MKNPDHLEGKVPGYLVPQKYPRDEMSGEYDYVEGADVTQVHAAVAREHPEPVHARKGEETTATFPLWLLIVFGVAIFWAGGYLFLFSGAFRPDVFNEREWKVAMFFPEREAGAGGPGEEATEDPVVLGQRFYMQNCLACHQGDGKGAPGQYPPLAGAEWVIGSEKRLAAIILNGLEGPITVAGSQYNNAMPAWGGNLNDKKIAYIMTYIRQAWGNSAPPVTPEQVAVAREEFAARGKTWTAAELQQQIPEGATLEAPGPAPAQGQPEPAASGAPADGS
jgi:mono/diheme cytochrome c family protein